MDSSVFWRGRRALVLGCTGFLGTHVVRALLSHGADVIGLIRDSQRPSEFFADRLHRKIRVVRGTADPQRLRSLIAIHGPLAVFQLASVSGQSHVKHRITAEFLRAVARVSPSLPVVVPVYRNEGTYTFRNEALGKLRVGFVSLPELFGAGSTVGKTWSSRLFAQAAQGRYLTPPDGDQPLMHAADAAGALLAAGQILTELAEAPTDGLIFEPSATITSRALYRRVAFPLEQPDDALAQVVESTVRWYERHGPNPSPPAARAAA